MSDAAGIPPLRNGESLLEWARSFDVGLWGGNWAVETTTATEAAESQPNPRKRPPYYVPAGYLKTALDPEGLKEIVAKVAAGLETVQCDAVAFRGLSGALVAPMAACASGKQMIAVRKGERTHSGRQVETMLRGEQPFTYAIVDDLISTGETVRGIRNKVTEVLPEGKLVAILLWSPCGDWNAPEFDGVPCVYVNRKAA